MADLPRELTFDYLEKITGSFSSKIVGNTGSLGKVYKGVLEDGRTIAVKRHERDAPGTHDKGKYCENVKGIMNHTDNNVVKLLAFCLEVRMDTVKEGGEYISAKFVETLFCYEYYPNGNLHTLLYGNPASNIKWNERFKIIKGICRGLQSLHEARGIIMHLNLKPQNILLDNDNVPKITDFVYSRIVGKENTRVNTMSTLGSVGYKAPEYLEGGEISRRADIYALGLIILEITTREENSPSEDKKSARDYVDKVEKKWYPDETRKDTILSRYPGLDSTSHHEIQLCIEIGLECVNLSAKELKTSHRKNCQ